MKTIRELATKFRNAIDAAKEEKRFDKDQRFRNFPSGCCGITSDLLAKYLYDNGVRNCLSYISATYYDLALENPPHAWLLMNDNIVIDITGDQFKSYPKPLFFTNPVYVGYYNDFYNSFEEIQRNCCGDCKLDNTHYKNFLSRQELYDIVCEYL